jgi:3-hydroxyacyl-CoA dehydrogenase/enoyl-CoA hydratase/carnithine racemase
MVVHVITFADATSAKTGSPLHPLGKALRRHIWNQVSDALKNASVTSIVLTGGGSHFSAGADLTEFAAFQNMDSAANDSTPDPSLRDVVQLLEDSVKPTVAAIQGACLGGGLEVALACHYRVSAKNKTQMGLPEVHVGVIPGAGGTVRLPRLVGLQTALGMILSGAPVTAAKAVKMRLVDAVTDSQEQLVPLATKWAAWAEVMPLQDRRVGRKPVKESPAVAHVTCRAAALALPAADKGGLCVQSALESIAAGCRLPLQEAMEREGELFLEVLTSQEGQARRHAFFAVRQAQKMITLPTTVSSIPAASSMNIKNHPLLQAKSNPANPAQVGVIGAGTMGSGIAMVLLQAGFRVILADVSEPALKKGMAFLTGTIDSYAKRRKITAAVAQHWHANLSQTQDLKDLHSCQLVVEAVIEQMSVKKKIFGILNQVTAKSTILLSNTSTLDLDQMAASLDVDRRARFAGWHFFSPAHVMKLVEIVTCRTTSAETTALLQILTKLCSKTGVVVGNCDGFVGNRMLKPYSAETGLLLAEGAGSIASVDKAFTDFGMSLGPFQMGDLAGNDIGYYVRKERGWTREGNAAAPNRPGRYTEVADDMVTQLGRLGQKAGKGWYDYDPSIGKGRTPLPSKEMNAFVQSYVTGSGRPMSNDEMVQRVFYPLVNEGFKILEEGIARCPSDIDVVYMYGYGWPAYKGGPMFWADNEVGLPILLAKLEEFSREFPDTDHYQPSALLRRCVGLGVTVEEYYNRGLHQSKQSKL